MKKEDVKFQRWLTMVSPSEDKTQKVLTAVDWNVVLQLLLKIFELLLGLGCFGRASVTRKVRSAMAVGDSTITAAELESILNGLNKKGKK
jgi:hypothetical protein